jgi:Arc/MetJ-type ribon-helix-helix transcriptional regulator
MGPIDSKSYQLRVRITADERDHLEKLRVERGRGETISDLVREAIAQLSQSEAGRAGVLSPKTQGQIDRLAVLLKREPVQVEEACVEGILDLIEAKCEVPLLVMETRLHLKYRNRTDPADFPWNAEDAPLDPQPAHAVADDDGKPAD